MGDFFYYGQKDLIRQLNQLALAKDIIDIPQNSAAAAASAAAAVAAAAAAAQSNGTAAISATAAAAAFRSLDARYLGAKALPPELDNAGGALLAGATYWDTVLNGGCLRVFQAGAWVTIPTNVASQVVSTPVDGIVATNVQAALAELDTKKAARAMTLAGYGITDALQSSYVPTWSGITGKPQFAAVATSGSKGDIGLGSVDNTADKDKPVSTVQRAALNQKANVGGDASNNFNVLSINGGPLGGIRNKLINPTLRLNQRSVVSANTSGVYIADCWRTANGSGGGTLVTYGVNYNDTTSANGFPSMYAQTGSTTKPSLAATDYSCIGTNIEGYDFADAMFGTPRAKSVVVSFRALVSPGPVTITVALRNKDGTRSYVAPVTIAAGVNNYAVVIPGDTSGAWDKESGTGASLFFFFACGATYQTPTPNSWVPTNSFADSSISNILDTAQKLIRIADIQLEIGTTATPMSYRSVSEDLLKCQRYYCNSFPEGVAPNFALEAATLLSVSSGAEAVDSLENNGRFSIKFPSSMRSAPTITLRGYVGNPTGWVCQGTTSSGAAVAFSGGAVGITNKRFGIASFIAARQYNIQGHWEASADL